MGWCDNPGNASATCEENGGDSGVGSPVQGCPLEQANIVWIKWVDGGEEGSENVEDTVTQWVNLPRDDDWVNGDEIGNIDRLGLSPRLKVQFDREGRFPFRVRFQDPAGPPAYTESERRRNGHFVHTDGWRRYTTEEDGSKVIADMKVVAGGGYRIVAEARDANGNEVSTGTLTTKRLVYFVEAKMAGLAGVLNSTADVESEYESHHLKLKKLPDLTIPHQENIGSNADSGTLSTNVRNAVNGSADHRAKNTHMLVVAYTDHLAVKNPNVTIRSPANTDVGSGKGPVVLAITAAGLRPPNSVRTRYLWHDIVAGEGWFVDCTYQPASGAAVDIGQAKCTPRGNGDYWGEVAVDVSHLPDGAGQITLRVNVVDRMRGGLALGGANQTCVCTKAWWRQQSDAKQACTAVHEIGHKVQQTSRGTGIQPDKPAYQYTNRGHVGSHCHRGCPAGEASYNTTAFKNASRCVMFGTVNELTAFCDACAPCVKKVDLTRGW